jgi:ribosomal protein S18 acetylase RimI-like enzyme
MCKGPRQRPFAAISIQKRGRFLKICKAKASDCASMLELFPRLASFDLPDYRNPDHLWSDDAKMLTQWAAGVRGDCFVHVAKDEEGQVQGVSMVTMKPELLSHSPSAHLEVLVVADGAEGQGVGGSLIAAAENEARQRGALSMSLHVFALNQRARKVYERAGYEGELMRYIKSFSDDALN